MADTSKEHPPPHALYFQALDEAEHGKVPSVSDRYRELMIEHGHLLRPGDDGYEEAKARGPNLPCGWPHRGESQGEEECIGPEGDCGVKGDGHFPPCPLAKPEGTT